MKPWRKRGSGKVLATRDADSSVSFPSGSTTLTPRARHLPGAGPMGAGGAGITAHEVALHLLHHQRPGSGHRDGANGGGSAVTMMETADDISDEVFTSLLHDHEESERQTVKPNSSSKHYSRVPLSRTTSLLQHQHDFEWQDVKTSGQSSSKPYDRSSRPPSASTSFLQDESEAQIVKTNSSSRPYDRYSKTPSQSTSLLQDHDDFEAQLQHVELNSSSEAPSRSSSKHYGSVSRPPSVSTSQLHDTEAQNETLPSESMLRSSPKPLDCVSRPPSLSTPHDSDAQNATPAPSNPSSSKPYGRSSRPPSLSTSHDSDAQTSTPPLPKPPYGRPPRLPSLKRQGSTNRIPRRSLKRRHTFNAGSDGQGQSQGLSRRRFSTHSEAAVVNGIHNGYHYGRRGSLQVLLVSLASLIVKCKI
jgi:hypothetical protein